MVALTGWLSWCRHHSFFGLEKVGYYLQKNTNFYNIYNKVRLASPYFTLYMISNPKWRIKRCYKKIHFCTMLKWCELCISSKDLEKKYKIEGQSKGVCNNSFCVSNNLLNCSNVYIVYWIVKVLSNNHMAKNKYRNSRTKFFMETCFRYYPVKAEDS